MKVEKEYRQDISMIDYTILNLTNVHVTIFYPQKKYCPDETNMEYLLNLFDTVVSIQKKWKKKNIKKNQYKNKKKWWSMI